jgi:large subunit ribosomal protein L10e
MAISRDRRQAATTGERGGTHREKSPRTARFEAFISELTHLSGTMSDKPASMYRDIDKPSYTRREYITGIPGSKVAQYKMGKFDAEPDDYEVQISLIVDEAVQIRHDSLEASRLSANRRMLKELGEGGDYKMILRKFPHQVIRENKQATGAGADRVSDGMRQSFGKIVGTAARIERGEQLFTIWCHPEDAAIAKDALRRAYNKISPPATVKVERGEELLIA